MKDGKDFDLIYVSAPEGRTMSLVLMSEGSEPRLLGPFPANEAGPKIVDALFGNDMGFPDRKAAEMSYIARHFSYMSARQNNAGQEYPYSLGG